MFVSIYTHGVTTLTSSFTPRDERNLKTTLNMAQFFLHIAKQACIDLSKGKLTSFDPIVGENTCQVRALHAISSFLDPKLQQEALSVGKAAHALIVKTNQYQNKPPLLEHHGSPQEIIDKLELNLETSEKLHYCFCSFLLTHGKYFVVLPDGHEISGIDTDVLRARLSKQMNRDHIQLIVSRAREHISYLTIQFIQSFAKETALEDKCIRKITVSHLTLYSSCAFFNFKAVLHALKVPILINDYRNNSFKLYYHQGEFIEDPKGPLFVFEVTSPLPSDALQKAISTVGLITLALANSAALPQYSVDNDISALEESDRAEIAHHRAIDPSPIFTIIHTHAGHI